MDRPRALFLIGPPGTGKSTWAAAHAPGFAVVSTDLLVEAEAARRGVTYAEAWRALPSGRLEAKARRVLAGLAEAGRNIVVDRTNLRGETRARFLRLLPPAYLREAVIFAPPCAEWRRRLEARAAAGGKAIPFGVAMSMLRDYDPPADGEFDRVVCA